MKKVLRVNIYFLIILLLEIFAPIALLPIYKFIGVSDIRILLFLNHVILFLLPAMIYIFINKLSIRKTLRLNKLHWQDTLLIILLGFLVQPVMTFFSLISSFFFNNEVGAFVSEITSTPYILLLGLVALLPSITEEVTIRGIVLSGYENQNRYIAAVITGLFFGILHLDPQQFLYATILGFLFALVVRITNSIYASMIMHFIINGTSVTLAKIASMIMDIFPNINEGTDFTLKNISISEKMMLIFSYGFLSIIFSVFVFLIIYYLDKINKKRNIEGVNGEDKKEVYQENTKERIINLPFVLIIVIYIVYMAISI